MKKNSYAFLPDRAYARELVRPWKLITFCISMGCLLYGSFFYNIADWDVGITILMGCLTYLMAPWSVFIIISAVRYRPGYWPLHIIAALIAGLFVVDWAYMGYHTLMGNHTFREANFYASMPLYFLAGTVWLYRGSLTDFFENMKQFH